MLNAEMETWRPPAWDHKIYHLGRPPTGGPAEARCITLAYGPRHSLTAFINKANCPRTKTLSSTV